MHTTLIETNVKLWRGQGVSEPNTVLCPNCKGNIENDIYTATLVEVTILNYLKYINSRIIVKYIIYTPLCGLYMIVNHPTPSVIRPCLSEIGADCSIRVFQQSSIYKCMGFSYLNTFIIA